jgi:oligosaccharide repeat unit polymerase
VTLSPQATPSIRFWLRRPLWAHPAVVFLLFWSLAIAFASWGLIPVFAQYANTAASVGVSLIVCVCIGTVLATLLVGIPKKLGKVSFSYNINRLFIIWAAISLFEIVLSGGLPIVWIVSGSGRSYEEFGLPTIHGFANAVWLYLVFVSLIQCLEPIRRPSRVLRAVLLSIWPALVVSRALFTMALLQFIFFYFFTSKRSKLSLCLRFLVLAAAFSLVFGYVGNIRSPEYSIVSSLGLQSDEIHWQLLLWIYAYIVSPISNLALNWQSTNPEFNLLPLNTFVGLLPSVLRASLGIVTGFNAYQGQIAHNAFNVATAFLGPFLDWDIAGVFLLAICIGFFGHLVWVSACRNALRLPLLCTFDTFVALSIFTNQFAGLTPLLLLGLLAYFPRSRLSTRPHVL